MAARIPDGTPHVCLLGRICGLCFTRRTIDLPRLTGGQMANIFREYHKPARRDR